MKTMKPPNVYRVTTLTVGYKDIMVQAKTNQEREMFIFSLLHMALASALDIVVMPEACWCYGVASEQWPAEAERRDSLRVKAEAKLARAYFVTATSDGGSQVMDPPGRSLGRTSNYSPVLVRDLPHDYEVFHIDYNVDLWPTLRIAYGSRIHLKIASEVAQFILESRDPALPVARIIRKHKLLSLHRALPLWHRRNAKGMARFKRMR